MRIAFITQTYPPMISGASLIVKFLAEEMAARDHDVLVITASDTGPAYCQLNNRLMVLRLHSLHNPFRSKQRFLFYPRRQVMSVLRWFAPDIIHTHEPLQLGILGCEFASRTGIPIIATIHALPGFACTYLPQFGNLRQDVEHGLWRYAGWILRRFDAVVVPSNTVARIVREKTGVSPQVISNGVDRHVFQPVRLPAQAEQELRAKFDLPAHCAVILHVGRLDVDKKVDIIVRAAALVAQKSDAHFLFVGDGQQKESLVRLCTELGIAKRCHFPGFITAKEGLPDVYRMASLFVTASEVETQGIVLLEATSSGLPIVAVRAGAIPEVVHSGKNGLLTEPGDINGIARAILFVIENPEDAQLFGLASARISAQHDLNKTFDSYEQAYQTALLSKNAKRKTDKNILSALMSGIKA